MLIGGDYFLDLQRNIMLDLKKYPQYFVLRADVLRAVSKLWTSVVPFCTPGLTNFNPVEGHTVRKDSPEGRTCVHVCRNLGGGLN
jgi:hypothetical protein